MRTTWLMVTFGLSVASLAAGATACTGILGDFPLTKGDAGAHDAGVDVRADVVGDVTGNDRRVMDSPSGDVMKKTDTGSDTGGGCGACPKGASCIDGGCECAGTLSLCGSACVDEQTDDTNCGGCGLMCTDCKAGRCVVQLAPAQMPSHLAVDTANVYWTDYGFSSNGSVSSVPLGGGTPNLIAPNQVYADGIAIDGKSVYWTTDDVTMGMVLRAPLTGGAPTTLVSGLSNPLEVAVDSTSIYWVLPSGSIVSASKTTGGGVFTIASGQTSPLNLALFDTNVYWTNSTVGGTVNRAPVSGGAILTLATGENTPKGLAADGVNVYWVDDPTMGMGSVKKITDAFGKKALPLAPTEPSPSCIAIDLTYVYWATEVKAGAILKIPIAGGTPTTLVSGRNRPNAIAVDATSVYWLESYSGTGYVMKVTPK